MEGRPLEDSRLAERARRGDVGAYGELVRRYWEVAFRVAFLFTGNASEAEDVSQEAFVKAYRAMGRFRPGAPFRPWLLRIVANEAKNRRRAAGRRAELVLRAAAVEEPSNDPASSPEEAILAGERRGMLLDALKDLREEDRLVIACRYFLDLSEKETATALGWPRGTVKSRLSRALGNLRDRISIMGSDPGDSEGASDG